MEIIKIALDIPVYKTFDYLPGKFEKAVSPGMRVLVPFGSRKKIGIVTAVKDEKIDNTRDSYKKIIKIIDPSPIITDELFEIAEMMAGKYFSTLGQALFSITGGLPFNYTSSSTEPLPDFSAPEGSCFVKKFILFEKSSYRFAQYLEIISGQIINGSVICIFPEKEEAELFYGSISKIYGEKAILYHSELKRPEKIERWTRMLAEKNIVLAGTRIASFAPLRDIKTIIADNANNNAYREQQVPCYNAIDVCEERSRLLGIPLYIGELSLSVSEYRQTKAAPENIQIIKDQSDLKPRTFIISSRQKGRKKELPFLHDETASLMEETILRSRKVAILHNKKGSSKSIRCEECKTKFPCVSCGLPLTLSDDGKLILCKFCKTSSDFEKKCTKCGSKKIVKTIFGIEKMYKTLKEIYTDIPIAKMTSETKEIDASFKILVGTQAIKKILGKEDFGLVILVSGESFLGVPDYRAEERFFNTVSEIKAAVKEPDCKIIIQTRNPNLEVYRALKEDNPGIFYEKELQIRKDLEYPPFKEILKIEIKGTKKEILESKKNYIESYLQREGLDIFYAGPSFPPLKRGKNIWKYLTKIPYGYSTENLHRLKEEIGMHIELNPEKI